MAVYHDALSAAFVFDDHLFFKLWCWQVEGLGEVPDVPFLPGCGYRPVRFVSLAIDHALWGPDPFGFHLTNVVLHGLVTLFVVGLLRRLGVGIAGSLLGALVWALHPVHTDAVTYVAGRRDLLCVLFFLAALAAWPASGFRTLVSWLRLAAVALLFGLAFQSKEMAVTLPLVIGLVIVYGPGLRGRAQAPSLRDRLSGGRGWALALVVALAISGAVYRGFVAHMTADEGRWWGGSPGSHALSALAMWSKYLELTVFPLNLYGDYSDFRAPEGALDPRVVVGTITLLSVWVGGLLWARKRPALSFGLLWLGITMLPVSQIVPHHEILAEHYLYLPLVGLAVPLGRAIDWGVSSPSRRRATQMVTALVIVLFTLRVWDRNEDFTSERAFAEAIIANEPDSLRGHLTLAHALQIEGDTRGALGALLFVAGRVPPGHRFHYTTHQNLLTTLSVAGRLNHAEQQARQILADYPDDAYALRVLGSLRARQGQLEEALDYLLRAYEAAPDDIEGRLHLGVALMQLERIDEAAPHIEYAARRWRRSAYAQLEWALLAWEQGRHEVARGRFQSVLALEPTSQHALLMLMELAAARSDWPSMCAYFDRLLALRPELSESVPPECLGEGS